MGFKTIPPRGKGIDGNLKRALLYLVEFIIARKCIIYGTQLHYLKIIDLFVPTVFVKITKGGEKVVSVT